MRDASLILLAAGMGSRFGGLKQIEPVGPQGELLIEYSIFDALAEGFGHVVFVIQRNQEEAFREAIGHKLGNHCKMSFVYQELSDLPNDRSVPAGRVKPWGTAHAVLACRDVVEGPFAIINADDYYGRDSYARIATAITEGEVTPGKYCLVGFDLVSTLTTHGSVSRGLCSIDDDGLLMRIDEHSQVTLQHGRAYVRDVAGEVHAVHAGAIASMNMWAFPHTFMHMLGEYFLKFLESARSDQVQDEYFLPGVVDRLVNANRASVRVLRSDSTWMGVTYREDVCNVRSRIRELIADGQYPAKLW